MTDEQITALLAAAENRASILYVSATRGAYEDGHLMDKLVECVEAQAAEIARLRAGIAEVKARGIAMQNEAHCNHDEAIGWGWECAAEWLEEFAQEAQETQP